MLAIVSALALTPAPDSPEPSHLMGLAASYAVSTKNEGSLPAPRNPTIYSVAPYYGYRVGGPLHVGLIGDAGPYTGSIALLGEVYGNVGRYVAIGAGLAIGPTWYWEERAEWMKSPGGRFAVHGQVLGRITETFAIGARAGFVFESFEPKVERDQQDASNYIWSCPIGVVGVMRL